MSDHETPNHGYNVPDEGTQNWHDPINENFQAFDADIEIRDTGEPGANGYDPAEGAKYLDTDTGTVYLGDGTSWTEAFSFGGGGGGGIESLTGGEGINPGSIGDGDTLSVAWGDADDLGSSGGIADWSGAADLDASGAITAAIIGSLSGGEGIDPSSIADGDELSVAWEDANDLDSDGNVTGGGGGGIGSLTGGDGINPGSIGDGDTLSVAWGDADDLGSSGGIADWSGAADLDASGNVTASFIAGLSGGEGIDPSSIADGDTVSVAWEDANDLDSDGNVTGGGGGGIGSLTGGDGINPGSIGDGDTLSVAWGDADDLGASGAIAGGAVGATELAGSGASDGDVFRWNGTSWETGFPGTTGDVTLELEGAGDPLLRLDPNGSSSPNVVAGNPNNTLNNSPQGATIAGGGSATQVNAVGGDHGTISGGRDNTTGGGAGNTVGGGQGNTANGPFAAIGGGNGNSTGGQEATVAGGRDNQANASRATVGGGSTNEATESGATVAGGKFNDATGIDAVVAGGISHEASGDNATVAGGNSNEASASWATVAGGDSNVASGDEAFVGGGFDNTASGAFGATVPGGRFGAAEDDQSFVWNDATGYHAIPNSNSDGLSSGTAVDGEPVTGPNTFSVSASAGFRFITGGASSPNVTYIDSDGTLTLNTASNAIRSPAGDSLTFETDDGERTLDLGPPSFDGAFIGGGNVVAGHPDNTVNNDAVGVAIGGGGSSGGNNTVGANYGTVSGGFDNEASGEQAAVGGGDTNTASGENAVVGGGQENTASDSESTVPGGQRGAAESFRSFVWNDGSGYHAIPNSGSDGLSSALSVDDEPVTGAYTFSVSARSGVRFVTGGSSDPQVTYIDSDGTLVLGGTTIGSSLGDPLTFETDDGDRTLELGTPTFDGAFVGGGNVVAGHRNNTVNNNAVGVAIGGGGASSGNEHTVGADYATVSGGFDNEASGENATVGGGETNTASDENATVGGGMENTASDSEATVPGGRRGAAESFRSFVWNDGTGYHDIPNTDSDGLSSETAVDGEPVTGANTFSVSANNGVRFITGTSSSPTVTYLTSSTGGWSTTSSRAVKTNIDPVAPDEALAGVDSMEIATWEYESEDGEGAGTTHIGPMAEEFHDAFDVGASDEHINSINADGVAFAAIQGLSAELDEARDEIAKRDDHIDDLEAENERLRERIDDLEAENERSRERNADLEGRLTAVEKQLGLDDEGATTRSVADD